MEVDEMGGLVGLVIGIIRFSLELILLLNGSTMCVVGRGLSTLFGIRRPARFSVSFDVD